MGAATSDRWSTCRPGGRRHSLPDVRRPARLAWVWSLLPDPPPVVVAPCCGRGVRLAELRGDFGECFARFCLCITDPDSWDAAPAEVLAGVEAILGVPVVSVFQRI